MSPEGRFEVIIDGQIQVVEQGGGFIVEAMHHGDFGIEEIAQDEILAELDATEIFERFH